MNNVIKLITIAALLGCSSGQAQEISVHKLYVAANKNLGINNQMIDEIIVKMNVAMSKKNFAWDEACANIRFERGGDVEAIPNLATKGTFKELTNSLKTYAPHANLMIASIIECTEGEAPGCTIIGSEPMVMQHLTGPWKPLNDNLWLHERGHSIGLSHSTPEPISPDFAEPEVGRRFMFWQLGYDHYGKNAAECAAFREPKFASVQRTSLDQLSANLPTLAAATLPEIPIEKKDDEENKTISRQEEIGKLAAQEGLTVRAYKLVTSPWVHRPPDNVLESLTNEDLDSIRSLYDKKPSIYWTQAGYILALRGNEKDIPLLTKALNLPSPAALPGDTTAMERATEISQIRYSSTVQLGIMARRTNSKEAIDKLVNSAEVKVNSPPPVEDDLYIKKRSLEAISKSGTEYGKNLIDAVISIQDSAPLDRPATKFDKEVSKIVPITKDDIIKLKNSSQ